MSHDCRRAAPDRVPGPPRVGHTRPTQLVLTTSRVGHPKVCGVFSSYRVAQVIVAEDAVSIRIRFRSGFLFVPSRTRVQNLRRISSPSVSDGTRVLMRKNVQSNHRTYSVNVWIKVGRECRRPPPGNCSSDVLRTGRTFAGRENQLSSISRHCSGVLPCCRQFDHRTWGWFGGFVTAACLSWSEECQLLAVHRTFRRRPEDRGRSCLVSWCTWFRRRILRWR